ncbi:MAG: cation transporter [Candidatus Latescibacteria bacterium]|nr:cation transporter [Candidatus Latescibacterota bacterium]
MRPQLRYGISLTISLFAIWLLWSGHYTWLLITLGFISCLFVVLIVKRMDILDAESQPVHIIFKLLRYIPWLVWQIVLANLQVARIVLHPRLPISPSVFTIKTGQRTDLGRAIHANSITLTPGTVSVSVEAASIEVHALTDTFADAVRQGDMDRRVTQLEGGA